MTRTSSLPYPRPLQLSSPRQSSDGTGYVVTSAPIDEPPSSRPQASEYLQIPRNPRNLRAAHPTERAGMMDRLDEVAAIASALPYMSPDAPAQARTSSPSTTGADAGASPSSSSDTPTPTSGADLPQASRAREVSFSLPPALPYDLEILIQGTGADKSVTIRLRS